MISRQQSGRKTFTLIELMVVIAIIGILMSILMPALAKAREVVKSSVCVNNQSSMYKAYMMHSDDGQMENLSAPFVINNPVYFHSPGQLLHRNNLQKRLKIGMLELENTYDLNCPTYYDLFGNTGNGSKSSYGSNSEGSDTHGAFRSQRLYFAEISSTSSFILMGCRNMTGNTYILDKSSDQLASYHPKGTGNVFCADGHVTSTKWSNLLSSESIPSLVNQ